jgi:hypothetical protein
LAGRVYLVNGQEPIRVIISDPASIAQIPKETEGIYIVRGGTDGPLYKVGEAVDLRDRMGWYVNKWLPHMPADAPPLVVDVYTLPGAGNSIALHAEKVLRKAVLDDGFTFTLKADGTTKQQRPQGPAGLNGTWRISFRQGGQ